MFSEYNNLISLSASKTVLLPMDMKINLLYSFSCNGYWEMKQKKKRT